MNQKLTCALLFFGFSFGISAPVLACSYTEVVPPSSQSRTYKNNEANFYFLIPDNYRTMGFNNGSISIFEPNAFNYTQCIIRNKIATEFPEDSIFVEVNSIRSANTSLYNLVIQESPWMAQEGFNFRSINFAGQSALTYSQVDSLYRTTRSYVSLLSRDRRYLITISGEQGSEELQRALASFQFE